MNKEEDIRLRRSGGVGSPGTEIPESWRTPPSRVVESISVDETETSEEPPAEDSAGADTKAPVSPFKSTGMSPDEQRERVKKNIPIYTQVEKIYNLELIIYTTSGQKFSARLNFLDRVRSGDMTETDARIALEGVENDFKYKTFRRPITYVENRGSKGIHEYVFNSANVVCVNLIRKY